LAAENKTSARRCLIAAREGNNGKTLLGSIRARFYGIGQDSLSATPFSKGAHLDRSELGVFAVRKHLDRACAPPIDFERCAQSWLRARRQVGFSQ
jgi:hypothetical protein